MFGVLNEDVTIHIEEDQLLQLVECLFYFVEYGKYPCVWQVE